MPDSMITCSKSSFLNPETLSTLIDFSWCACDKMNPKQFFDNVQLTSTWRSCWKNLFALLNFRLERCGTGASR